MISANPSTSEIEELAALLQSQLKKHVVTLTNVLRRPDVAERLADELDVLLQLNNTKSAHTTIEGFFSSVEASVPSKAALLHEFHERFQRKEILTTATSRRALAQTVGAVLVDGRRNQKNELAILIALSSLSTDILRDVINSISSHPGDMPSSLQQWHDIIMMNARNAASKGQLPAAQ